MRNYYDNGLSLQDITKPQIDWVTHAFLMTDNWKRTLLTMNHEKSHPLTDQLQCYSGNPLFLTVFQYIIHEMLQLLTISILHHMDLAVNHFSRSSSDFSSHFQNKYFFSYNCTKNLQVRKMPVQKYIFHYVQFVNKIHLLKYGYFKTFDT